MSPLHLRHMCCTECAELGPCATLRCINVAVHDYQKLSLEVVKSILEDHLDGFRAFSSEVLSREIRA